MNRTPSLTASLGIHGWRDLDALLLAALSLEAPVLLVGAHGTAKTLLAERVAGALGLEFRHYNASLLNYDDLVGIPMPSAQGTLEFVSSPGSIWGAEFAFFDEISRCRPDLQNKLFPLVHERRVAGVDLPLLRHRWAAMNPPCGSSEAEPADQMYLGSEELDPALVDRFPFILSAPGWRDLSREDRLALVCSAEPEPGAPLASFLGMCLQLQERIGAELGDRLAEYVVQLLDHLQAASIPQSPRRARMLHQTAIAVHAARLLLQGDRVQAGDSVEQAILHGLPQNASPEPPSALKVRAAHQQAWKLSGLDRADPWRQVLAELDPLRRVVLADRLDFCDSDLSRLVLQALASVDTEPDRIALSTAVYARYGSRRDLTPAAWETLCQYVGRLFEPRDRRQMVGPGPVLELWQDLQRHLGSQPLPSARQRLERNFLLAGFPDLWLRWSWRDSLATLRRNLDLFEVSEVAS